MIADSSLPGEWAWLGVVPYGRGMAIQDNVRNQIAEGRAVDTLLLLEHQSVITLGRSADSANIVASAEDLGRAGIAVAHTSRGGDVTYHGPGQLVGYPVFRLRRGVRAHVKAMADGIIAALATLGIEAEWHESRPGVWVGAEKICAVGVHVRRRVATHGFALNVNTDLSAFRTIVPCGLRDAGVTSIAKLLGTAFELENVAGRLVHALERSFFLRLKQISASSSRLQIANENL